MRPKPILGTVKKKITMSILAQVGSSHRSTRTMPGAEVPGHLVISGEQSSGSSYEQPGLETIGMLEEILFQWEKIKSCNYI